MSRRIGRIDDAARELDEMRAAVDTHPHIRPFLALVDEALALKIDEREWLMERLIRSVEADPESISPELQAEIERRLRSAGLS